MNPVWQVRSRQMLTRFRFWAILSGYDPRDHSLTHKIYLVYASIFWSIWVLAVLGFAASGLARIFETINPGQVLQTAVLVEALGLFGWTLYSAYQAAGRSPIAFSEEDAYLICLTSVDRRQVTLAWLLGDWPYSGIPFWVLGSVLGFTVVEAQANGHAFVVSYILSALVCLSILIPFHFGLMALVWGFGASRLQADEQKQGLVWVPIISGLLIVAAGLIQAGRIVAPGWAASLLGAGLDLLLLPARAGLGSAGWLAGEIGAFAVVLIGLGWLIRESPRFNLSRAAQETSLYVAQRDAVTSLNQEAANEISLKQQLGVRREPIRIPVPAGLGALLWKDLVQALRGTQFSSFLSWVQLFGAALGIFLARDWGFRLAALFFWILFSNQVFSRRLRLDLKNWSIFTQLPFDPLKLVLAELGLPVLGSTLLGWLALWLAGGPLGLALLVPGASLGMALVTSWDILRQCASDALLAGDVPGVDIWSFVVGALAALLPFGFYAWLGPSVAFPALPFLTAFLVSLALLVGLAQFVQGAYRGIE